MSHLAKSSSTSSLSKPGTPKSKPSSPRPRSRSKTREDNGFFLWIPEIMDDIENQMQSKKRTLELLNEQTGSIDKEMQEQLLARDKHISSLNKTILELKTIIREREDSKKERNWAKEFSELEKEFQDLKQSKKSDEGLVKDLENEIDNMGRQFDEEKDDLIAMQETLKEESIELKTMLDSKEKEIEDVYADMNQINVIVETMTKLNNELHAKLEAKNGEMEKLNIQSHDNLVKAKQAEELERRLNDYIQERLSMEKRLSSLLPQIENVSRVSSILDWAEKNLEIIEDGIKKQFDNLSNVNPEHIEKALIDVNFFFQELANSVTTIKHNLQKNKPKPIDGIPTESAVRQQLKEMEIEMEKNQSYIKGFKDREAALQEEIRNITSMMEKHSIEYKNDILLMSKQSDTFKDQTEKMKDRVESLRKENEKLTAEISQAKLKINHITGKFEQLNKRKKDFQENEAELKKQVSELKEKLSTLIDTKKSSARVNNSSELKLKKVVTQAQILRDEVFRKDSELVKAARERMKLEQEIDNQKNNNNKLHGKMKTIEAELIEKISSELEEKDRQIEILKEMLRSAHSEIKLKDSKITTLSKGSDVGGMKSPRRG